MEGVGITSKLQSQALPFKKIMPKEDILYQLYSRSWINQGRRILWDTEEKRSILLSHLVWNLYHPNEPIRFNDGQAIHHEDENRLNDHPYNLKKKLRGKHTSEHNKGSGNGMYGICRSKEKGGFYGKKHTDKSKLRMSISSKGKKTWMFNKKHSEETKLKMSLSSRDRIQSKKEKAKRSKAMKLYWKNKKQKMEVLK